jgi:hypothetical protein
MFGLVQVTSVASSPPEVASEAGWGKWSLDGSRKLAQSLSLKSRE